METGATGTEVVLLSVQVVSTLEEPVAETTGAEVTLGVEVALMGETTLELVSTAELLPQPVAEASTLVTTALVEVVARAGQLVTSGPQDVMVKTSVSKTVSVC